MDAIPIDESEEEEGPAESTGDGPVGSEPKGDGPEPQEDGPEPQEDGPQPKGAGPEPPEDKPQEDGSEAMTTPSVVTHEHWRDPLLDTKAFA